MSSRPRLATVARDTSGRRVASPRRLALGLLALLLWPPLRWLAGPDQEIRLRVRSDAPIAVAVLRAYRHGLRIGGAARVRPRDISWPRPRPVEVDIEPLGEHRAGGLGSEVWVAGITSRCGPELRPDRLRASAPWHRTDGGVPVVWPGGAGRPLRYKAILCNPVQVVLGRHPYSGRVRVSVLSHGALLAERRLDLYAPETHPTTYRAEPLGWFGAGDVQELSFPVPPFAQRLEITLIGARSVSVEGAWCGPPADPRRRAAIPLDRGTTTGAGVGLAFAVPPDSSHSGRPALVVIGFWLAGWLALEGVLGATHLGDTIRSLEAWGRYGVVPLVAWALYWLAFFPGVISYDPLIQWGEIVSGRYTDWHPTFHTWLLAPVVHASGSFAPVGLVQVVLGAALFARLVAAARRIGAPGWLAWCVVAWVSVSPVFGFDLVAVWKDTAFGLVVLWLALILLCIAEDATLTIVRGIEVGVLSASVCLIRHNGPAVALPTLLAMTWCYGRVARRAVLAAWLVTLGLVGLVRGPLYRVEHVAPASPVVVQHYLIHQVAALLHARTPLSASDGAFLKQLLPLSVWRSKYACHSAIDLLFKSNMPTEPLVQQPLALVTAWWHLVRRNPRALLGHLACVTRFVWYPRSELYIGPFTPDGSTVDPNQFAIATTPLVPRLHGLLTRVVLTTSASESWLRPLVWQPAISLYLLLAGMLVVGTSPRSRSLVLVLLPGLCNTLVWLLLPSSPDMRFQWPVILLAPVAVLLAGARRSGEVRRSSTDMASPSPA